MMDLLYDQEFLNECMIEESEERGYKQGIEQGIEQGKFETLIELVNKNTISVEQACTQLNITEDEFKNHL